MVLRRLRIALLFTLPVLLYLHLNSPSPFPSSFLPSSPSSSPSFSPEQDFIDHVVSTYQTRLSALQEQLRREQQEEKGGYLPYISMETQEEKVADPELLEEVFKGAETFPGDPFRLKRVLERALVLDLPLRLGVLGGSVSAGMFTNVSWPQHVIHWIDRHLPHPGNSLRNAAIRAAGAFLPALCLSQYLGNHVDLVLTEFEINGGTLEDFRLLYSQLLNFPSRPALLQLAIFSGFQKGTSSDHVGWVSPFRRVCREGLFNVTLLDAKAGVYPFYGEVPPFNRNDLFAADHHHFGPAGHRLLGLLVVQYLRRIILEMRAGEARALATHLSRHPSIASGLGRLPAQTLLRQLKEVIAASGEEISIVPEQPVEQPGQSRCYTLYGPIMEKEFQPISNRGWQLREQEQGKSYYEAVKVGSEISFEIEAGAPALLAVVYLRSPRGTPPFGHALLSLDHVHVDFLDGHWNNRFPFLPSIATNLTVLARFKW